VGRDSDVCLRATAHPEFDAWRWAHYWVPLDAVIAFKRRVYQLALIELSRYLDVPPPHTQPQYRELTRGTAARLACRAANGGTPWTLNGSTRSTG